MKFKSLFTIALIFAACYAFVACNDEKKPAEAPVTAAAEEPEEEENHGVEIKAGDVKLTTPLDQASVASGQSIYELKCQSCHKLTDERLVGPGWKDVTKRREPHWIMNMITNVDMMLEKDPEAQKLLEQCLVRMPNQNITTADARHILEFMRSVDGVK
ncbi:MAG: cytochrome c [Chitinophagaceae bacterium]|nr:MAG: cytochrome c [Chitinophagaceae bacterium]